MRAALISDVHVVGGPHDPVQPAFCAWLDALATDRLYLLGDIFHAWWGYPGLVPPPLAPTCDALQRVRNRGIPIHLIPGNHDFAVGPWLQGELGIQVHEPGLHTLDGVSFFLAHGDEADRSPGYRLTRRVLRGRPFAAVMRALGPQRGLRLIHRLAGASRHQPADPAALRARQQAWARPLLDDGADYVVMGHIHAPGWSADQRVIHLGGWEVDRTWCLVEDGNPSLQQEAAVPRPQP